MRTPNPTPLRRIVIGAVAGLALFTAVACGSDAASSDIAGGSTLPPVGPTTTDPTTTDPAAPTDAPEATDVAVGEFPERIVSLSPTATEMMFAIGAGDRLVAVDDQSNYPAEALALPNELSGFEPNVEAIASFEPDLVLIGGDFTGLGAQLDALGIAWWDGPAALTIDDSYRQIEELGDATGNSDAADALVKEMQASVDEIVLATPEPVEPLTIFHELDPTYFSADSTTFIGELYSLLGLRNIADRAEGNSGGFPQLSPEFIVSADPDLIFLADTKCCQVTADTVAARPGWDAIAAVRNGNVFEMDDDVASRWGPRVVEYLRLVSEAIQQAVG
jgi:iron complex transport system substrate-binding protein